MHMIMWYMSVVCISAPAYVSVFRLKEALCNLQVLILKNASLSLTCNESD